MIYAQDRDIEQIYLIFKSYLEQGWSVEVSRAKTGITNYYFSLIRTHPKFRELIYKYRKSKGRKPVNPEWLINL